MKEKDTTAGKTKTTTAGKTKTTFIAGALFAVDITELECHSNGGGQRIASHGLEGCKADGNIVEILGIVSEKDLLVVQDIG